MPAVVIDTNVLVSGLLGSNVVWNIVECFIDGQFDLIFSRQLLKELTYVAERPHLTNSFHPDRVARLNSLIKRSAKFIEPKITLRVCRDPKDNQFLEVSLASKAKFLITRDKDLLILNPFHHVEIVTPREFLTRLKK